MTHDRFLPRFAPGPAFLAVGLWALMAAISPASAQGGGGSGAAGNTGASSNPATTGQGSGGQPGQAAPDTVGPGPRPGLAADRPSPQEALEQARDAGVAAPPEQRQQQLQDLNEISRRLAPSVPVPAPGLEGGGPTR